MRPKFEIEEAILFKANTEVESDPDVERWSSELEALLVELPHDAKMRLDETANAYAGACLRTAFLLGIEVSRDPLKWILAPDQA